MVCSVAKWLPQKHASSKQNKKGVISIQKPLISLFTPKQLCCKQALLCVLYTRANKRFILIIQGSENRQHRKNLLIQTYSQNNLNQENILVEVLLHAA